MFYYSQFTRVMESLLSAGFRGGPKGPRAPTKWGPHHVHMFSHICDMCMPLNLFHREKFVCRRLTVGQTAVFHLNIV